MDKATKVTFNEPVQVPGKVLPAGTYVFRLQDSTSNRHIVQIFNEDHTSLITTVLAIPNYRLQPTGKTVLTYDERPADQPMALAAWFYPGDSSGQEFAYPKSEAEQLSRRNKREVPSTGSEEAYPADLQQRSTRLRPRTRNRYRKAKLQPRSRSQSRQIRLWRQIPRRLRQRKPLGRVKLNCRTRPPCYRSLD